MEDTRPIGRALAAPRRGLAAFFHGLAFSFRGARRVYLDERGLARYWLVPIVVTVLALVAAFALVYAYAGEVTSWLWTEPTGEGWEVDLAGVVYVIFEVLVWLVLALVALVATLLVSSVVSAPFNARLAEILDERITGKVAPAFSIGRALRDVGRVLVIEILFFVVNAVLLLLSLFVPALGPITGPIGLVIAALYFGIAYLETPQATRGRSLAERWRLVRTRPMEILGFGAGVGLFLFVPLVNLLFMPAAVAGGVMLHAELDPG